MPRFVLLYHDCPEGVPRTSHWDFMLESRDVLRTWALEELPRDWRMVHLRTLAMFPNCPPLASGNIVTALQLADHRRDYLNFEGALGGGRGSVIRVVAGNYEEVTKSTEEWCVKLSTEDFSADVRLLRGEAGWMLYCS